MKLPLLFYINLFSDLLPIGTGIYSWKGVRTNQKSALVVFIFLLFAAASEYASVWMATQKIHNLWVLHLYHLGEYIFLMVIFLTWLKELSSPKTLIMTMYWSIPSYFLFWLVSKWTFEKWDEPANYTHNFSMAVFIGLCLYTIYKNLRAIDENANIVGINRRHTIFSSFSFWIALGLLIYFSGSTLPFLLIQLLTKMPGQSIISVYAFHWGANLAANILYSYGLVCLTLQ